MFKKIVVVLFLSVVLYGKEILLLHSYHKGYDWSDEVSKAIDDSFKDSDVEITYEYMDTKHIYNTKYEKKLVEFYKTRYQNRKFDLIIASDNNALNLINKYQNEIFTDVPIVFCGINNFNQKEYDNLKIRSRTTGVVEAVDIEKNIQLILKLHPNISKLFVVNDSTTTGQEMKKDFFNNIYHKYKNKINIEYIDKFTIDELKNKVSDLDKNSVILFMLLFKDKTGKVFTFKDGLQQIEKISRVPIYGLWDFYIDYGLVGGFVTHGYAQGEYAANLAKDIFKYKDISKVPIIEKSPNSYIFDYEKLKNFNIKIKHLPKDSIVINKPFSFYDTYKVEITIVAITFIIFIFIIIMLIISLSEKRKAKNEFKLQLQFIETLLNSITNPIFYKDKAGHYIGCNQAFCEFIGKNENEILGKTMYDFFSDQKEFLNAHEEIENKLFNNESVDEYIMSYIMPNNEQHEMLISKTLYYDLEGNINGILTVLHDITDLVKVQKEKKQHESFLVQQSKLAEIGEMISAIAHQWNEPLVEMSAIVQDLELQHKTSKITNDDIKVFVSDSMVQIQYMSKTLKDFRDFLKPSVKKSNFYIKDAFDEVLNILERQIKYSYIELNIYFKSDDLVAYGYKNEFMQVLITILNNSKDAIAKKQSMDKEFKGKITINILFVKNITKIIIRDNGCGIEDENKDKVFEPYYSTKSKGNGLGLYMSKVLIDDKMNGKIYFDDCRKDDTVLIIELPRGQEEIDL